MRSREIRYSKGYQRVQSLGLLDAIKHSNLYLSKPTRPEKEQTKILFGGIDEEKSL